MGEDGQAEPSAVSPQVAHEALGRHLVAGAGGIVVVAAVAVGVESGRGVGVVGRSGVIRATVIAEAFGRDRPSRKAAVPSSRRDAQPLVLPSPGPADALRSSSARQEERRREGLAWMCVASVEIAA